MNARFKNLTRKLADQLEKENYAFFMHHLNQEEVPTDVINLTLSAHLSSLFNCMTFIARDHEEEIIKIKEFIAQLEYFISKLPAINSVESL